MVAAAAPTAPVPHRWVALGTAALALAAIGGFLWWLPAGVRDAWLAALAGLPAWAWLALGAAWLASYGVRALRLRHEWLALRPVSWRRCLSLTLAHNLALALAPMRSGEIGYVWLVRREWGVPWGVALASLARLRHQDVTLLGAASLWLLPPLSSPWRLLLVVAWLTIAIAGIAALLPRLPDRLRPPGGAVSGVAQGGIGWICSALNWSLRLVAAGAVIGALSGLGPRAALAAALGGELAALLPLAAPGNLGSHEAGAWAAVALLGPAPVAALVAAVATVHVFCLMVLVVTALADGVVARKPRAEGPQ